MLVAVGVSGDCSLPFIGDADDNDGFSRQPLKPWPSIGSVNITLLPPQLSQAISFRIKGKAWSQTNAAAPQPTAPADIGTNIPRYSDTQQGLANSWHCRDTPAARIVILDHGRTKP